MSAFFGMTREFCWLEVDGCFQPKLVEDPGSQIEVSFGQVVISCVWVGN
jgi:hypothetical protein